MSAPEDSAREDAHGERGAALALVLVMLAIMSMLAAVVLETSRFSVRRTANQAGLEQARWYLIGAEGYALRQIARLNDASASGMVDQADWQNVDKTLPLDTGAMTLRLRDGSNCFNLNSVVLRSEDGMLTASPGGQIQFARLLDATGVRLAGSPDAVLADWIDSDEVVLPGGAEDAMYVSDGRGFRVANTLLGDLSELRRIAGFSPTVIDALAPLACVRPDAALTTINVNTILPDQAAVLSAVMGDGVSVAVAQDVIRSRPRGGWADVDAFLAHPRFSGLEIPASLRAQLATRSRYYVLQSQVRIEGGGENALALIDTAGRARIVRRVFGVGAEGYAL